MISCFNRYPANVTFLFNNDDFRSKTIFQVTPQEVSCSNGKEK